MDTLSEHFIWALSITEELTSENLTVTKRKGD